MGLPYTFATLSGNVSASDLDSNLVYVATTTPTYLSGIAGTNAITGTPQVTPTVYVAGQRFSGLAAATNTGAVTLDVGLGPGAVQVNGAACTGGEIVASRYFEVVVSSVSGGTPTFQLVVSSFAPVGQRYTNSLSADVSLSNVSNFFDGPSVAQGTQGTWFASGTVTLLDSAGAANFDVKLWDATSNIASAYTSAGSGLVVCVSLSGIISSPAANIRISVRDVTSTSGVIKWNVSSQGADSTLSVFRIA
ncbi:MAG: hypothetical protein ACYDBH_22505 [Acidobacteriaceae bacterium]